MRLVLNIYHITHTPCGPKDEASYSWLVFLLDDLCSLKLSK